MKATSLLADPRQALRRATAGLGGRRAGASTLGDVDSYEALEDYQAKKRAHKAAMRAARAAG